MPKLTLRNVERNIQGRETPCLTQWHSSVREISTETGDGKSCVGKRPESRPQVPGQTDGSTCREEGRGPICTREVGTATGEETDGHGTVGTECRPVNPPPFLPWH